jgi:hypothetical protein
MAQKDSGVTVGAACTVTSGPNQGKTGTYSMDDDGKTWCEGDWGATQCDGSKCQDGATSHGKVFEYPDTDGLLIYEVDGLYEVEGQGIFRFKIKLDAATGATRDVAAVRVAAATLSDLRKSGSDLDRTVAEVIDSYVTDRRHRSTRAT